MIAKQRMNHLRELLDTSDRDIDWPVPTDVPALMRSPRTIGEQAVCFWLGDDADLDSLLGLTAIPELIRLPYTVCWFEGEVCSTDVVVRAGMLAVQDLGGSIGAIVFSRASGGRWSLVGSVHPESFKSAELTRMTVSREDVKTAVHAFVCVVKAFLSALHCANVSRQEHPPDIKLQKARAKRGKRPLFSYWTLQLKGRSERGSDQGGQHASPRVHLRRGHPRQFVPGKWTWVQAHAVGNRAAGMVHKDYRAGPALIDRSSRL